MPEDNSSKPRPGPKRQSKLQRELRVIRSNSMTIAQWDSTQNDSSQIKTTETKPQTDLQGSDRRAWRRQECAGSIWWKSAPDSQFNESWLIERSTEGAAFLTRQPCTPSRGADIVASRTEPKSPDCQTQPATIKRVDHIHADMFLVAVQFRPTKPDKTLPPE